jgi:Zn ribbon nucleic-acid-binding protein
MMREIGIYKCPACGGAGKLGLTEEQQAAIREAVKRMGSNLNSTT